MYHLNPKAAHQARGAFSGGSGIAALAHRDRRGVASAASGSKAVSYSEAYWVDGVRNVACWPLWLGGRKSSCLLSKNPTPKNTLPYTGNIGIIPFHFLRGGGLVRKQLVVILILSML